MSTNTVTVEGAEPLLDTLRAGVAGGIVGGVGMGVILHGGANMMPLIGALYGWPTVLGGWVAHLLNSVLIGLLFALIVSRPLVRRQLTSLAEYTAAGLVYAAAVGLVMTGVVIPIAMRVLGVQTLPESLLPVPGVIGGTLVILSVGVAHMVFGVLLGATCGFLRSEPRSRTAPAV